MKKVFYTLLLMLVASLGASAQVNLMHNPGFDEDITGQWQLLGPAGTQAAIEHLTTGGRGEIGKCIRVTPNEAVANNGVASYFTGTSDSRSKPIGGEGTCYASMWVKGEKDRIIDLTINHYVGGDVVTKTHVNAQNNWYTIQADDTWEKIELNFETETANDHFRFVIRGHEPAGDQKPFLVDDIHFSLGMPTSVGTIGADDAINIYPNPTSGVVYVSGATPNAAYAVYTVTGAVVKTGVVESGQINLGELQNGIYVVKIGSNILKITVQK